MLRLYNGDFGLRRGEMADEQNLSVMIPVDIEAEMRKSYLDYAMSVIIGRALPDVRDGLKPVHRRILFGMYELGLTSTKPYRKCAKIVGEVLGKYHPHGDTPVYDALVRMAQDFNMRYPLVDGDRKSTRLNSSHRCISYAVFCLKKKS